MNIVKQARLMAITSLEKKGINISDDTLKKYKIKRYEIDSQIALEEDQKLIDMANEILLGRYTSVSNGGGGFENVILVRCTGVVINPYNQHREVRYDVNDDWIGGVYYDEEHIIRMFKKYKETNILPVL